MDHEVFDLGIQPRLILYLNSGRKRGMDLTRVANYTSAVRNLEKLEQAGLVKHTIETGSRTNTNYYELTKTGQEVADLLEKINEIIIKNIGKKK